MSVYFFKDKYHHIRYKYCFNRKMNIHDYSRLRIIRYERNLMKIQMKRYDHLSEDRFFFNDRFKGKRYLYIKYSGIIDLRKSDYIKRWECMGYECKD